LKHKLETDEDVVSQRCEFEDCKTHPSLETLIIKYLEDV
jgi:hypothetical protein